MQVSAYPHPLSDKFDLRVILSELHVGPDCVAPELEKYAFDVVFYKGDLLDQIIVDDVEG
jgi:hypothetical protein